jgi:two-component system, OmpR family, phosphate regulon sensor histidine kinase PhoR
MSDSVADAGANVVRLLEHAPDPVLVVDGSDTVRHVGGPVGALFGAGREALVGRPLRELLPGWHRPSVELAAHWSTRVEARRVDGAVVPVECSLVPVPTGTEQLTGVFVRDISARVALENENDRIRDDLAANVSHELKTPLTSVVGYAELLRELPDEELGPVARRLVDIVHRNARRELLLVEDLLAVTFTEEHLARLTHDRVDLLGVVAAVVEEREPYAHAAGVRLVLEAGGPVVVQGDAHHLGRVVDHLVVNGYKFSPPGSEVTITVAADASSACVTVADTGIGISAAQVDKVFERLYRAPGAIARLSAGAGLGLAVARTVVEAHRGTISLESAEGVGTTVRVVLPRVEA